MQPRAVRSNWDKLSSNTLSSLQTKSYGKLRVERANARLVGTREKRAKDEAAKDKEKA